MMAAAAAERSAGSSRKAPKPDILTLVPLSYRTAPFPSRAIDGFLISDSSLALTCSSMHTVQRLTPGPFFHWLPLKPLLLNSLWHSAQIVVVLASMLQTVASHGGDKRAPSPVTPAASIPHKIERICRPDCCHRRAAVRVVRRPTTDVSKSR